MIVHHFGRNAGQLLVWVASLEIYLDTRCGVAAPLAELSQAVMQLAHEAVRARATCQHIGLLQQRHSGCSTILPIFHLRPA